jgi:hypothetical protein
LGQKLVAGNLTSDEEIELDDWIQSHQPAMQEMGRILNDELGLPNTPRLKTRKTLREKVGRGSNLARIRDIAGVRLDPWASAPLQQPLVEAVLARFPDSKLVLRLDSPNNGYRAIHVVVVWGGRSVEVQIRTALQHEWADAFEKFADIIGQRGIRYGELPTDELSNDQYELLMKWSEPIARLEASELGATGLDDSPDAQKVRAEHSEMRKEAESAVLKLRDWVVESHG